jgi:IS4 transposase
VTADRERERERETQIHEQVKFFSIAEYGTLREKCFRSELFFTRLYRICEKRLFDSSHLSVRMQQTRVPPDGFSLNLIFEDFRKSVEKILELDLKFDKNDEYFT